MFLLRSSEDFNFPLLMAISLGLPAAGAYLKIKAKNDKNEQERNDRQKEMINLKEKKDSGSNKIFQKYQKEQENTRNRIL